MEILFTEVTTEAVAGTGSTTTLIILGFLSLWVAIPILLISVDAEAEKVGSILFGIFVGVAVFFFTLSANVPKEQIEVVYHEVILVDGETIDAMKYEIVEQRGKVVRIKELQQGE